MSVSKSAADKAGDRLRKLPLDGPIEASHIEAFGVLSDWRGQHAPALLTTTMGLRSAIAAACGLQPHGRVSSRLKKEEQILAKLWRGEVKRLSSMRDIAGCRAIVDTLDQAYRLADRICNNARKMEVLERDDRMLTGTDLGYHAIHLYGARDSRAVEIQIRTLRNHDWAERVERYDRMTGEDAKHGRADAVIIDALRELGDELAQQDQLEWGEIPLPLEDA